MRPTAWVLTTVLAAGCSAPPAYEVSAKSESVTAGRVAPPAAAAIGEDRARAPTESLAMMGRMMGGMGMADARPARAPEVVGLAQQPPPADPALGRKIIYTADLALVVEDFARAEPEVGRLVQKYQGYIAEMTLLGSPGAKRSARWKVRVPVESFESFLADIARLGELERNTRSSDDVSAEYYDLDARIKNKRVEEARLQKILEENTGKIEDVLKVETELSRVRGEIEQMEGRLRMLQNLTALTTVTVEIREREKYQPPPPVAASFPTQVQRTFQGSLQGLVEFGQAIVLGVVAIAPWLPLIVVGLIVAWLLARFLLRQLVRWGRRAWALARTPIVPPQPSA
jgi:hypothetical protein